MFPCRLNMIRISPTDLECRPRTIAVTPTEHERISGATLIIQTIQWNHVPCLCAILTVLFLTLYFMIKFYVDEFDGVVSVYTCD